MDLHSHLTRGSVREGWAGFDVNCTLAVLGVRKEWNGPHCSKRMERPSVLGTNETVLRQLVNVTLRGFTDPGTPPERKLRILLPNEWKNYLAIQ